MSNEYELFPGLFDGEQVLLPTGGEDFGPTGLISTAWRGGVRYMLWSEADLKELDVSYDSRVAKKNGWWYYWKDGDEADRVDEETIQSRYGPKKVFSLQTAKHDIINAGPEFLDRLPDVASYDIAITSMRKGKQRYAFQFIFVPALVAAYGKAAGMPVDTFDLSELTDFTKKAEDYDDDLFETLFGNPATGDYSEAVYAKRREALWNALGEDDMTTTKPIGTGKGSTKSKQLSACLQLVNMNWGAPICARVVSVNDPKPDEIWEGDEGYVRRRIHVVYEVFRTEAEAREAAAKDAARFAAKEDGAENTTATPPVPVSWETMPEMWYNTVKAQMQKPRELALAQASPSTIAATAAELEAWMDYFQATGQ